MRKGIRHPARLVPLGFLVLISIGTALLMLPAARSTGVGAPLLTALFTSTSAVCVTGLVVVDTPVYWSTFGQWIILGLFQAGGLGIMTGATLLGLLVLRWRWAAVVHLPVALYGALIEFVETKKIPIIKKLGGYLDLSRRDPAKPLPKIMLKALGLNRRKP